MINNVNDQSKYSGLNQFVYFKLSYLNICSHQKFILLWQIEETVFLQMKNQYMYGPIDLGRQGAQVAPPPPQGASY